MATHLIIGTGVGVDVPQSVINESLRDVLDEGDMLAVPWYGKPSPALASVYDYIFDQEIQFILISDGTKVAKAFSSSDHGVVVTGDMVQRYVQEHVGGGVVMVLGGEDDEVTNDTLVEFHERSPNAPVVDLGDGLTAVEFAPEEDEEATVDVADEDPTAPEPQADDDPDPFSFTSEELAGMPVRVLKKLTAQVVDEADVPKGNAKAPYIGVIEAAAAALADELAREEQGAPPKIIDLLDETFKSLHQMLLQLQENDPSRTHAMMLTNVEQAMLWYHHGDRIHGGV